MRKNFFKSCQCHLEDQIHETYLALGIKFKGKVLLSETEVEEERRTGWHAFFSFYLLRVLPFLLIGSPWVHVLSHSETVAGTGVAAWAPKLSSPLPSRCGSGISSRKEASVTRISKMMKKKKSARSLVMFSGCNPHCHRLLLLLFTGCSALPNTCPAIPLSTTVLSEWHRCMQSFHRLEKGRFSACSLGACG